MGTPVMEAIVKSWMLQSLSLECDMFIVLKPLTDSSKLWTATGSLKNLFGTLISEIATYVDVSGSKVEDEIEDEIELKPFPFEDPNSSAEDVTVSAEETRMTSDRDFLEFVEERATLPQCIQEKHATVAEVKDLGATDDIILLPTTDDDLEDGDGGNSDEQPSKKRRRKRKTPTVDKVELLEKEYLNLGEEEEVTVRLLPRKQPCDEVLSQDILERYFKSNVSKSTSIDKRTNTYCYSYHISCSDYVPILRKIIEKRNPLCCFKSKGCRTTPSTKRYRCVFKCAKIGCEVSAYLSIDGSSGEVDLEFFSGSGRKKPAADDSEDYVIISHRKGEQKFPATRRIQREFIYREAHQLSAKQISEKFGPMSITTAQVLRSEALRRKRDQEQSQLKLRAAAQKINK